VRFCSKMEGLRKFLRGSLQRLVTVLLSNVKDSDEKVIHIAHLVS